MMQDTRSFREIWEALNLVERMELKRMLVNKNVVSEKTVRNWAYRERYPISISIRLKATKVVEKFMGCKMSHITLFPCRKTQ